MGERLAVDPHDSKVIYLGARSGKGLYRSTDGGVTFAKVSSFTAVGTYVPDPTDANGYNNDIQGLAFVTFDDTSGTASNGRTKRIFVGTADNTTASVYVSNDAGETWAAVPGQPGTYFPHKCRLQPQEKALYLSYSDGSGPYDGTKGAVYRYDITAGTWKDITPATGDDLYFGFGGLSVDLQKPGTVMVATLNSWWPDAQIFRTTDSGATWSKIWEWAAYPDQNQYYSMSTPKAPWIYENFVSVDTKRLGWMIEALEINPQDSNHWLYGTGLTIYGGHDLAKWDSSSGRNVTIQSLADGIEEFAVLEVTSVPGGSELLAAVGDDSGFTFKTKADLGTSPKTAWNNPMFTSSTGVDYAGNSVKSVVRVGNSAGSPQVALSNDGGATWNLNYAASNDQYGGRVAYSANADTILWSSESSGVLRSQYQGSFTAVSSVPSGAAIASDKKDNAYFYAGTTKLLVSSDIGATFSPGGSLGAATSIRDIAVHPTVAGELWVSTDVGIFHSTDHGATLSLISSTLTNTHRIALGKGSGSSWILYAFGHGPVGARLYATADNGASWQDIQGSSQGFGAIDGCRLAGSANEPGLVYVGTNGRGVLYAQGTVQGGGGNSTSSSSPSSTAKTSSTTTRMSSTSSVRTSSTLTTSTRASSSSSSAQPTATDGPTAPRWGQCGGIGWTGPTRCESPYACQKQNDWYHQCL